MVVGRIYLITNKVNGKQYVGQTKKTIQKRWNSHMCLAKKGSSLALHNAIRKYGKDKFTLECLEEVSGSHVDLMAAEIRQIALHSSVYPSGYNLTHGGDGVDFTVPEIRDRMLEAAKKKSFRPQMDRG